MNSTQQPSIVANTRATLRPRLRLTKAILVGAAIVALCILGLLIYVFVQFSPAQAEKEARAELPYMKASIERYYAEKGVLPFQKDLMDWDEQNRSMYTNRGETIIYKLLRPLGGSMRYVYKYWNSSGSEIGPKYKPDVYYENGKKYIDDRPGPSNADIAKISVELNESDPLGECNGGCFRGTVISIEVDKNNL
ncbi:hypothetical protein JNM87_06755 [Candidatus Saccharibacteria bacterium]|nr:hypothetical protein [Candidatus Saccharibacteria bacterium]